MDSADDEISIVLTAPASVPAAGVWDVLIDRTAEWWTAPYLDGRQVMHLEPGVGGRVWASEPGRPRNDTGGDDNGDNGDDSTDSDGDDDRSDIDRGRHGTIRAWDPPERLEIGGVLVPGAYAGSITITIGATSLGSEIRVEHQARGRIEATVEERISTGWTSLLSSLTALADA